MPALSLPALSFLMDPIVLEDWPLDRDGKTEVFPLVAYETFGVLCGLKLHYLESPADLVADRRSSAPLV